MISRISFFKLIKEEWKHHLVSILVVVLTFMAEILFFYFDVNSVCRDATLIQSGIERCSKMDVSSVLSSMFLAVFLAAESFSYLHSQKKTDFYMSLPIKRNVQFLMAIGVSMLIFFIPCAAATFIETGIVVMKGYGSTVFLKNMAWLFLGKGLVFMAAWVTMALAVILTGHLAVAVMVFGTFCAYIPLIIKGVYPTFASVFYDTYVYTESSELWYYFSPVSLMAGFANAYDYNVGEFYQYLTAMVIFILVVGLIGWKLYEKRPAEAAKRAMAFEKANSVIRFMIVVPFALYFGYFLNEMSMTESRIWLVIGVIVGVILFHGFMESIYAFDPRKMFARKKQAFATICICLGILGGFCLTKDMYNGYLPCSGEVKGIKLTLNSPNISLYDWYEQTGISGEAADTILELAEQVILQNNTKEMEEFSGSISIKYEMENGKEKGRVYGIDVDDEGNRALLDQIFATEGFKENFYDIYSISNEDITDISLENSFVSEKVWLSEEEQKEFLDIYRKDLGEQTFTEMEEKAKLMKLRIRYSRDNWIEDCYIYEDFDETIAFLKEHNVEVKNPMEYCEVLSVELFGECDEEGSSMCIIQNPEVLNSFKDRFILADLYDYGYVNSVKDSEYALVEIKTGNRIDNKYVYIREPEIKILRENAD